MKKRSRKENKTNGVRKRETANHREDGKQRGREKEVCPPKKKQLLEERKCKKEIINKTRKRMKTIKQEGKKWRMKKNNNLAVTC